MTINLLNCLEHRLADWVSLTQAYTKTVNLKRELGHFFYSIYQMYLNLLSLIHFVKGECAYILHV